MVYTVNGYTPKQGDFVIINFNPSIGREIKKRRPAIVVSANHYNAVTGMCAVCPITDTKYKNYIALDKSHKLQGYINPFQIKTFDFMEKQRNVRFVEKATLAELGEVAQIIDMVFDFSSLLSE